LYMQTKRRKTRMAGSKRSDTKRRDTKRRGTKQKIYKMKGCSSVGKGGTKKKYHKPQVFVTYTGGKGGKGSVQGGGCGNAMCPLTQGGGSKKKRGGGLLDYPSYIAGNIKGALLGTHMQPSPNPTSGQFAPRV
jgi:hypothetical protein